jgi:alanine dehydrogenase
MIIGVPREIKDNENRVAAIPAGVQALVSRGHKVLVQKGAGACSGISYVRYVRQLADKGWVQAARENPEIARELNIVRGHVTSQPVAFAHHLRYVPWTKVAPS